MNARALAGTFVFVLAACGGGGSAGVPGLPIANPPFAGPPVAPQGSASLTITVPPRTTSTMRSTRFVSPNAASLVITVVTVNGIAPTATQAPVNPTTVALSTAGGGNCTVSPSGETCTVALPAPTGSVKYLLQLEDGAARVLATNTVTFTIVASAANQSFAAQLNGVVASVVVTAPKLGAGTSFSGPITVQAFDASGALIVGSAPYANAFTLTDNDASGHTSLTDNGTTALTVTVLSPNDVVILNYDGASIAQPTFTATIPPG